jgi:hypothetical protein
VKEGGQRFKSYGGAEKATRGDERILGGRKFAEQVRQEIERNEHESKGGNR